MKIRGHDPGAKSPHINPVQRYSAASIFLLLSPFVSPFSPPNRETRGRALFFYFKNERGGEGYSARAANGASGRGDTLLIKTIDLSPGLRMHLEINTRARAQARKHLPRGWKRAFPDDHLAWYLTLGHLRYSPSAKIPNFLTAEESESDALK